MVPPSSGICHQINLEYLGRVVIDQEQNGTHLLYPDTLLGTDSHTTMINGIGVMGWGVGAGLKLKRSCWDSHISCPFLKSSA